MDNVKISISKLISEHPLFPWRDILIDSRGMLIIRRHLKIILFPVDLFSQSFFKENNNILVNSCPIFKRFSPV